jgi:glyceraldehyde 3-phosphate dehydrogenase
MTVRIAINGFGRTGRALYRAVLQRHLYVEVVAINDLGDPGELAYLLRRDSVHGPLHERIALEGDRLVSEQQHTRLLRIEERAALPWKELGVDIVAECTGAATRREVAALHLAAGAQRVVVSAPCRNVDATFVIGVNDERFDPMHHFVVSNASCTTNCFALLAKVLDDEFGIESGLMSTVHAYTGDQALVDSLHRDPRRGRAAALNIVPTSTGAARATGLVLEDLRGRVDGMSLRVPVADGSITDFVALLPLAVTREDVNDAFRNAAEGRLGHVLDYSDEGLVSSDIVGATASCIFDASLTMAQDRLVKVFGWYDNEAGYSNRLAELCALLGARS